MSVPTGVIGGVLGVTLCTWVVARTSSRPADADESGWCYLRPSLIFPIGMLASFAFLILPVVIIADEGFPRTWGEAAVLLFFIAGAGFCAGEMAYYSFGLRIRFNPEVIEVHRWFKGRDLFRLRDILEVQDPGSLYDYRIHFSNGGRLRVSKLFYGNRTLLDWARDRSRHCTS